MKFEVIEYRGVATPGRRSEAVLLTDNWNDWFKFETTYVLIYYDNNGVDTNIGTVKIGQFGMKEGQQTPNLPKTFESLADDFFSLGQDESYYEKLNNLGDEIRDEILTALRDSAFDLEIFEAAKSEDVFGSSLMRYVSPTNVTGQFARISHGGVRLTEFKFNYIFPRRDENIEPPTLSFTVTPESNPPTNVHVLIGRNGVGKTFALNAMTRCAVSGPDPSSNLGSFKSEDDIWGLPTSAFDETFSSVVSVTFSAFDPFEPVPVRKDQSSGVQYHYVGLKYQTKKDDGSARPPKDPSDLAQDFAASIVAICANVSMQDRWSRAVALLDSDPLFKRANVQSLLDTFGKSLLDFDFSSSSYDLVRKEAKRLFHELSSGHKIVLLTLTRLVETVSERSLVLLDEPEAHLHPPLLASFIRSLSDLLIGRNAVALIATHSPVILQEVPRSCVWKVRRAGKNTIVERPEIETYGENVGILTHEAFGLEVSESGFYSAISKMIAEGLGFDEVLGRLDGKLGQEGRIIARSLLKSERAA